MNPSETGSAPEERLAQNVEISTLCAFYGGLLTQRQRTALLLHYDEDLSLGEIAEQLGVSRQNIHDLITRSAQKLQRVEEQVGAIASARQTSAQLQQALDLLRANHTAEAISLLSETIAQLDGEE